MKQSTFRMALAAILVCSAFVQASLEFRERQQNDDQMSQNPIINDRTHLSEGHLPRESKVIFFIFVSLTIGGLIKHINKKYSIAYAPLLFLIGCIGGACHESLGQFGEAIKSVSSINPHGILIIFLPVMIFQSGYSTDWHIFRRQSGQILILALPCVILSSLIIMGVVKLLYPSDDYPLTGSFLLGSLLSWTDTVAIGAILQEIGAPKRLNSLIKGESLANDITCVVLYRIVKELVRQNITTLWESIGYFFLASVGGILLGILFGIVTSFWIKKIFNDEIHAVNIVLVACYLIYFVGMNISLFGYRLNGIILLVSFGLFMSAVGKKRINNQADQAFRQFWTYISFCAETVIFILAGVIVVITFLSPEAETIVASDYYKLLFIYIASMIARLAAISVFMYFLQRLGYGLTWKEVYILAFGGLKGAVGISIALIISQDEHFKFEMRQLILFEVAGNTLLTLIINGSTLKYLVQYLKISATTALKEKLFIEFLEKDFKEEVETQVDDLKESKYLKNADWNDVTILSGAQNQQQYIQNLYQKVKENQKNEDDIQVEVKKEQESHELKEVLIKEEENKEDEHSEEENIKEQDEKDNEEEFDDEDQDQENEKLNEETVIFIRNIFLKRLKLAFWDLLDQNQCQGESYLRLIEAVDWDLDIESTSMNNWSYLKRQFHDGYINFYSTIRNWTIIGRWAKKELFQHISCIYDMVHSYIEAHKIADTSLLTTKYNESYVNFILVESEENILAAKKYLDEYLDMSFPEISESIRTKKVAYNILNYQKDILKDKNQQGQLDEKEFFSLKKKVDQNIITLNNLTPSWSEVEFEEFIKAQPLFQLLNQHIQNKKDFNQIIMESTETRFQPDQYVFKVKHSLIIVFPQHCSYYLYFSKQNEKATNIYVITRGCGTENYKNENGKFSIKRGVGHIVPIQQLIGTQSKYYTEFQADSLLITRSINISKLSQFLKCHYQVENHIIRESLPYLCRIFYTQFSPLSTLDFEKIEDIINKTSIKRVKKGQTIEIASGGILAKGELQLYCGQAEQQQEKDNNDQIRKSNQSDMNAQYQQDIMQKPNFQNDQDQMPDQLISSYAVLLPNTSYFSYTASKSSLIFEFLHPEEIRLLFRSSKKSKTLVCPPSDSRLKKE